MSEQTEAKPGQDNKDDQPLPHEGDALLEQIAQRRFDGATANTTTAAQNPTELQDETPQATGQADKRIVDDLDGTFVKAKVYGEEREVPISELVKHYQIDEAAEIKLRQAKELEAKQRQEYEAWKHQQAQAEQQQQTRHPDQAGDGLTSKKEALRKAFDAWSLDEEFPDDAVNALFAENSPPASQPDPAAFAAQVEFQLEAKQAEKLYQQEYSDIAKDPILDYITGQFLTEIMGTGNTGLEDGIRQASEKTREWVKQKAGVAAEGQQAQTSAAANKRQQAQANLRHTPTTSASARQPINQPKQLSIDEARRAAIAEMMSANG